MDQTLLIVITLIVMLIGVVGVVVPLLPDIWLIWLAALGYGIIAGFDGWVGIIAMALITLLTIIGLIADIAMSHAGAASGGASWQGILASFVLGTIGLFIFPPIGPLVGALVGLFLVEYFRQKKDVQKAWRAITGYAAGCGLSMIVRLGIAIVMILIWGGWVWIKNF